MIQCPSCGFGLRFDIASQEMICDACDSRYDPAVTASSAVNKEATEKSAYEAYVYLCPSCGGQLLTTDKTDAIGYCPFCGGASMLFDRVHEQWEPKYIIPFKVTKEQCKELYAKAARRSILTSKKYRDPRLIEDFRGIYMPYWNYQAIQRGHFRMIGERNGIFTKENFNIYGETDVRLDGYAHDAALTFDDRISEDIAPFDPKEHKPFAPGYLSGFYADIGDVVDSAYNAKATECMMKSTAELMAQDNQVRRAKGGIACVKADINSASVPTQIVSSERVLYPVWFMSYRNKDKLTYAAVNGQTGKVSADLPVSPLRIMTAVLALGALLAAAFFLLPSVKANVTLALTAILLLVGMLLLRRGVKKTTGPGTGLSETEEAVKFKKHDSWRLAAVVLSAILGIVIAFTDPAYNVISYSCCLLLAAELFYIMFCHIRFQADIAKRRPPQFNKKGAARDEA